MPPTDSDGLRIAGISARRAGHSYYENPMLTALVPLQTIEQLLDWHDLSCAWAEGWISEDAGRDQSLCKVLSIRWQ